VLMVKFMSLLVWHSWHQERGSPFLRGGRTSYSPVERPVLSHGYPGPFGADAEITSILNITGRPRDFLPCLSAGQP
jgi:hypothetical protein